MMMDMIKWRKEYAGCYYSKCGTFKIEDVWHTASGSKRIWNLYSNDNRYTLEDTHPDYDEGRAVVDSYNTLAAAKFAARVFHTAWSHHDQQSTCGA